MFPPGTRLHRLGLGILLLGNTVLFAGLDPPSRAVTAAVVLAMMVDLRRLPSIPSSHRLALTGLAAVVLVQLTPLPLALRQALQPGLAGVLADGWAPLSVAPWSTLETAAGLAVAVGIAVTAARMASTRTGLPALLGLLAGTAAVLTLLGLVSEAGMPDKVMLLRDNTGRGGAYGPFVNSNHFALALELTLPAAMVLMAVSARHLTRPGEDRQRGAVLGLASLVVLTVGLAALLRAGSRGGILFMAAGALVSAGLWLKPRRATRWPWLIAGGVLLAGAVVLASTRLPYVVEDFKQLLVIEGVEGNSRTDLWAGTVRLAQRAPLVGVGLGAYRNAIGLDKPATGAAVLEQAHNDWLEWVATTGALGAAVLLLAVIGTVLALWPGRVRWLRFEYRYPLAGAAVALAATSLHELVDFGLQIPLNRYLLACWLGLVWGVGASRTEGSSRSPRRRSGDDGTRRNPDRGIGEGGTMETADDER